ncbi:hypothetical protein [Burkholderia cenocepacia]|uniref:hypothetical protein n=1 Tax=Burkholderia cenocepacia TaxID=95486 RepID=UPI0012372267|nr:hypothetical protein [Burkholderia cenocepacia]
MQYRKRVFTTGPSEAVSVYVRRLIVDGQPYVVFREDAQCAFKGALRSHFEKLATLYYVELLMRGYAKQCASLRFVFEKPAWTNGLVTVAAEWREVSMIFTADGYRSGKWRALTEAELRVFSGESQAAAH